MKIKKIATKSLVIVALLGIQAVFTSSCTLLLVGAAAGGAVAGTAFYMGKFTGTIKAVPSKVQEATQKAFKELKITQTKFQSESTKITIIGADSAGRGLRVVITAKGTEESNVAIRFGTYGDKDASSQLFTKIQNNI